MREVAVWRSYVYAVNQIGRAAGPPLGGIISDLTDWRWYVLLRDSLFKAKTIRSLLLQVPFNVLGILLIWRTMKLPGPKPDEDSRKGEQDDTHPQVNRIDFLGALSLGFANTFLLLFLDRMQSSFEVWKDTFARATAGACITFAMTFVLVEAYWAREPILPLRLILRRNVLSSYLIQFFQTAAQMAVGFSPIPTKVISLNVLEQFFTSVPLYFRISQGDSNSIVSIRLLIITTGTTLGGLISGWIVKRYVSDVALYSCESNHADDTGSTGLYRRVTLVALVLSNASFLVIFLRWRGGTGWWGTLYGFPIGLGFGVSLSAAFIGLAAGLESSKTATATSGFYLSLNLGSLFGVSLASLLISASVQRGLLKKLENFKHKTEASSFLSCPGLGMINIQMPGWNVLKSIC
jgi:MFS family permease